MNTSANLFTEGAASEESSELVSLAFELARDREISTGIGNNEEFQVKTTLSVVDNKESNLGRLGATNRRGGS